MFGGKLFTQFMFGQYRHTPLFQAVVFKRNETVHILIKAKANLEATDEVRQKDKKESCSWFDFGNELIYFACKFCFLVLSKNHATVLHRAVRNNDSELVSLLLANRANITATNDVRERQIDTFRLR